MPLFLSIARAHRIDEFQASKVLFVVRNENAAVRLGDGRKDHVQRVTGTAGCVSLSHEPAPNQRCAFIKGENPPCENCLWSVWTSKPAFQFCAPFARRLFFNAAPYFRHGQGCDEQILIVLVHQPVRERMRGRRLGGIAQDIRIEQIAAQRSIFRGFTAGRLRFRSAMGQRRSAAYTPPFLCVSDAILLRTAVRISAASGLFSASRRAKARTSSRSESRPRTSKRARPSLLSRFR